MASPPAADDVSCTVLTDYERRRLENVKRNQAIIAALGIQNAKAQLAVNASRTKEVKGYTRSGDKRGREREVPVVTRRLRSSRVSWKSEDAQKLVSPPTPKPTVQRRRTSREANIEPVPLSSSCIKGSSPESLLRCLEDLDDSIPLSVASNPKKVMHSDIAPTKFSLQKGDIARVVPERIMSNVFVPVSDKLLIVAGDKEGNLGFWDVDFDGLDGDAVHVFQPHEAPVSGISIASFSASKVFTSSYDGTLRWLDAESSMFDLLYHSEDDNIFSAICSVPGSASCIYVGEGRGLWRVIDTRVKGPTSSVQIHERTINTIDLNKQSPWQMVTSSTDRTVCVWDVRKLKSDKDKICIVQHLRGVQSAEFSPSGSHVATCSYDDTIAILKLGGINETVHIQHPNKSNKWISTFRAIWGWDDKLVYVSNMRRSIDIISTELERECHWLSSPRMKSIPCRLSAHPLRPGILAGCAAGGQIFIWRQ